MLIEKCLLCAMLASRVVALSSGGVLSEEFWGRDLIWAHLNAVLMTLSESHSFSNLISSQ